MNTLRTRFPAAAGWVVIPVLVLAQFVDLRRGVIGNDWTWSAHLVGFGLLVLIGLPLVWRRMGELRGPGWIGVGLFTLLVVWALFSALTSGTPLVTSRTLPTAHPPDTWALPRMSDRIVPLVTAWVTMAAGIVTCLLVPRAERNQRLWWAGAVLLATSALAWPRSILAQGSVRMATGMGGSATIHLAFLTCLGLFLGSYWQGLRPRASLGLAGASLVGLLLTGSRAGLLCLGLFLVLVLVQVGRRVPLRTVLLGMTAVATLVAVMVLVNPAARRLLTFGDPAREANWRTAMAVWQQDAGSIVLGVGSGRLWPWYAFDARFFRAPHRSIVGSSSGQLLTNPHSLPLGVLVELGLVGLLLLLGVVLVMLGRVLHGWRHRDRHLVGSQRDGLALAMAAGLLAFCVDHYLLKNFSLSWWWWCCWGLVFTVPDQQS